MARASFAKQLARKFQPILHITPSAVLVLVWNFLMYSYYTLLSRFTGGFITEVAPATWYKYGLVIVIISVSSNRLSVPFLLSHSNVSLFILYQSLFLQVYSEYAD